MILTPNVYDLVLGSLGNDKDLNAVKRLDEGFVRPMHMRRAGVENVLQSLFFVKSDLSNFCNSPSRQNKQANRPTI